MEDFWARYGDWLLLGAVLLLFTRMHGMGGCCGGHRHGREDGRHQAGEHGPACHRDEKTDPAPPKP